MKIQTVIALAVLSGPPVIAAPAGPISKVSTAAAAATSSSLSGIEDAATSGYGYRRYDPYRYRRGRCY